MLKTTYFVDHCDHTKMSTQVLKSEADYPVVDVDHDVDHTNSVFEKVVNSWP